MTRAELESLPEEIAAHIELWDGRVVWVPRGPAEHQTFSNRLWSALERCARKCMSELPDDCWRVTTETNVFLGAASNPPTRMFARPTCSSSAKCCPPPTRRPTSIAKKGRYASAGIPWYWEVTSAREASAIAVVRAYALETAPGALPEGVRPLRSANYLLAGEWTHDDPHGVAIEFPFPISIPWSELEY